MGRFDSFWKRGKYSLRAFPIGGYVNLEGEEEESKIPDLLMKSSMAEGYCCCCRFCDEPSYNNSNYCYYRTCRITTNTIGEVAEISFEAAGLMPEMKLSR